MFQRGRQDARFSYNSKARAPTPLPPHLRPMSTATEIYDSDEEEEDNSEIEDDEAIEEPYSPRVSLNSAGRRSETTLSSYEELNTPKSNNFRQFDFQLTPQKSVEGPRGPHLFRPSDGTPEEDFYLTMSLPATPYVEQRPETAFKVPVPAIPTTTPFYHRPISTLTEVVTRLDNREVAKWTAREVARWMYREGFQPEIVQNFEENDVNGEVLITLRFEDLKELDITSFGERHKVWNIIHKLRDQPTQPPSPTVIDCESSDDEPGPRRKPRRPRRKGKRPHLEDIISPLESVSIVGIEQLMPKEHKCAKGENCSRWRKQQRIIEAFNNEHPISPPLGGKFLLAGDPGNPATAEAARPFSDAQPSVVASSDVLGPGILPPVRPLEEATLANLQVRDPQDNVKQFLNFQHIDMAWSSEEPATPPLEMFPTLPPTPAAAPPAHGLRSLPKLAIPVGPTRLPPRSQSAMGTITPGGAITALGPMERAEAVDPRLRNNYSSSGPVYRFGTPASDMDVPVTAVNLGPVSRDASQSVPPNMNYRHHSPANSITRTQSRSSKRPSFGVLPRLDEYSTTPAPVTAINTSSAAYTSPIGGPKERSADDVNHSGWMKKRKTKMLRHEWHEHHFTLKGTRLAMHKDARSSEILEAIDVDDYAIACSSLASSKLNAAFKAMNIKLGYNNDSRHGGDKIGDEAAFAFQLIPAAIEKGQKIKKNRESKLGLSAAGTKTHHFAVKSRDERIDWMRELMLAKALKQKGEGYEINLNGNMI